MINHGEEEVKNVSFVLAEYTSRYMAVSDLALRLVQAELQRNAGDVPADFQARMTSSAVHDNLSRAIQNVPGDNVLLLFGADGQLVNQSRSVGRLMLNAVDRDFFTHSRDHDDLELYVGAPDQSLIAGHWTFPLARRLVTPDGQFFGVVVAAIDIEYLHGFFRAIRSISGEGVTLLMRNGVVVARHPDPQGSIGTSMPANSPWYATVARDGGTYRSPGFFGASASIVAARPLHDYPLVIDVILSESEVLKSWRTQTIWQGVATFVVVSCFIVLFGLIDNLFRRQQLQSDQIRQERDFSTASINSMPGLFVLIDRSGRNVRWNTNLPSLTGLSDEQLQNSDAMASVVENDREMARNGLRECFTLGSATAEFGMRHASGELRTVRWSGRRITRSGVPYVVAVGTDLTDIRQTESRLRLSEAKYRDLFDSTLDAIMLIDPRSGSFISVNPGALKLFRTDEDGLLFRKLWEFSPETQPDGRSSGEKARAMLATTLRVGTHLSEWTHRRSDGSEFPADVLLTRVIQGDETLVYATVRDISERKRASEQISYMARHDGLTGLPNRRVFVEALEQRIARAHRETNASFAVLFIDLDHFKDVNDTLGHPAGDLLLQTVAKRLRASVRKGDTVARFGGDEFAVMLTDIQKPSDAAVVSDRILGVISELTNIQMDVAGVAGDIAAKVVRILAEPIAIREKQVRSGGTVGIAIYGPDSPDAETMLARADLALYRAKADGRGTYRFFTEVMDTEVRARVRMNTELLEAIALEQLFLVYQPQVDVASSRIVGLEALVRWHHPSRGILGPSEFIPQAEQSGLIVPLGQWVIRAACRQTRHWLDAGIAPPLIAVNLSGVQLKSSLTLANDIAAIIAEFDLPPTMLELELTESVLMEVSQEHNELLLRLRRAGHRIAIDDFGSGYSSLEYLRRYPVDRIKIAQAFIADVGIVSGNDAVVRAALGLARELDIEVVVEGVETKTQLELLKAWGCRIVQGYYYARPILPSEVTGHLLVGKIYPPCAPVIRSTEIVSPIGEDG